MRRAPPAEGERRDWFDLPPQVREALELHLKARVIGSRVEPGGFSPGVASRLALSDGRRVFAKVLGPEPNLESVGVHRREARILAQMPSNAPVPKLLSVYDDGEWVALFLEEIEGRPPLLPWTQSELRRVVRGIESLVEFLTPAPFSAPPFGERYRRTFNLWREMLEREKSGTIRLNDLDPWAREHLHDLASLEEGFEKASAGSTLLHCDLRADNILIANRRVYFADWPGACIGAGWIDLLGFLPSVAMQGGPKPWTIFDQSSLAKAARTEHVNAILAAVTGYFLGNSRKPPPPGLSTLRPFQRAQGVEALAWLRHRLDFG